MAGPSFYGPASGWTASSLAPKTNNLPISDTAVAKFVSPQGWGGVPVSNESLAANNARLQPRIEKAKTDAAALEKKGDQASLEAALDLRKKLAVWENAGQPHNAFDLFKSTVDNFTKAHPDFKVSAENQRVLGMADDFSGSAPELMQSALGIPVAPSSASGFRSAGGGGGGGSRGGSDLSQYELSASDYGLGLGPDPRAPVQPRTPLEQLLAQISPDLAAGAPPDPFANPRPSGQAPSTFQNVIAGLFGQQAGSAVAPPAMAQGPSFGGPAGAPSYGANVAASIPGAPPFLAGAINGVQGFNPYASPQPTYVAPAPKLDFGGLAQLSAEQRIQAAQMAKDKAAAQAKWFASQAKQEQINAEQANMSRLKGFSNSGWTPAMPTY